MKHSLPSSEGYHCSRLNLTTLDNRSMTVSLKYRLRKRDYYEHSRKANRSRLRRALRTVRLRSQLNGFSEEGDSDDSREKLDEKEGMGAKVNRLRTARSCVSNGFYEEVGSEDEIKYLEELGLDKSKECQISERRSLTFDPFEAANKIYSCKFCDKTFDDLTEKFQHWPAHLSPTDSSAFVPPSGVQMVEDVDLYENVNPGACHQKNRLESTPTVFQSHLSQDNYATSNTFSKPSSYEYIPEKNIDFAQVWAHILKLKSGRCLKHMCKRRKIKHFYKCLYRECHHSTNVPYKFYRHSKSHGQEKLPCVYCFKFFSPHSLMVHMTTEHSSRVYQCSKCFYRSALPELLENHHFQQHANHRFLNMHCPAGYHISILKYVFAGSDTQTWKSQSSNKCSVFLKNLCLPPDEDLYYVCNLCNKIGLLRKKNKHYSKHPNASLENTNNSTKQASPYTSLSSSTPGDNPGSQSQISSEFSASCTSSNNAEELKEYSRPPYKCKYCDFGGDSGTIVRTHCKTNHPHKPVMYTCPINPVSKSTNSHPHTKDLKEVQTPPADCPKLSRANSCSQKHDVFSAKPLDDSQNLTINRDEVTEAQITPKETAKQGIKIYICTYCLEQFTVYPFLYKHWKEIHLPLNDKFQFTTRRVESVASSSLQEEIGASFPKRLYCKECQIAFNSFNEKFKHIRAQHWKKKKKSQKKKLVPKKPNFCWKDKINLASQHPDLSNSDDASNPAPHEMEAISCIFCKKLFKTENSYSVHLRDFHHQNISTGHSPGLLNLEPEGDKDSMYNLDRLFVCLPSVHSIKISYISFIKFINTQPKVVLQDTLRNVI